MNDLSPEARRTLAQAKSAQPRASEALRARVKENVLRTVAAADLPLEAANSASTTGLSKSAFAKLPAWTFPTLGAIAVISGIATFAAQRSSIEPRQHAATTEPRTSQNKTVDSQSSSARRQTTSDPRVSQDRTVASQSSSAPREGTTDPRASQAETVEPPSSRAQRQATADQRLSQDRAVASQSASAQRQATADPRVSQDRTDGTHHASAPKEAMADRLVARGVTTDLQPSAATVVASADRRLLRDEARADARSTGAESSATDPGALTVRRSSQVDSLDQAPSAAVRELANVDGAVAAEGQRATQPARRAKAPARERVGVVSQSSQEREGASAHARDTDLRAEMQLLARAEAALRANEPMSALSILETHARELRSGQLQGERDGLRLIAQCTLGRDPQSALTRYLREHRDGVLQARIRTSCARFLP